MKKIILSVLGVSVLLVGFYFLYTYVLKPADERWADYKTWKKASEVVITGPSLGLKDKHGGPEGYRYVYVNSVGEDVYLGDGPEYIYPEGTILVKEQTASKSDYEKGEFANTVMVKLKEGESPETGDWGYVYRLNGPVVKGKDAAFCSKCHSIPKRTTGDHVFTNKNFFKK